MKTSPLIEEKNSAQEDVTVLSAGWIFGHLHQMYYEALKKHTHTQEQHCVNILIRHG